MAAPGDEQGEQVEQGRGARWRRRVLNLVLVVSAILGPLIVRVAIEGRAELDRADQASSPEQAIVHLGRAARWRLPIFAHDDDARARLEALADRAEAEGEDALALVAWRELRGALLGTRTSAVVDAPQLERANSGIVRGMQAQARASGEPSRDDPSARWQAELDAAPATDSVATHLAALCFLLWWLTLVGFVVRGIAGSGRWLERAALGWGVTSVLLLLAWILLM